MVMTMGESGGSHGQKMEVIELADMEDAEETVENGDSNKNKEIRFKEALNQSETRISFLFSDWPNTFL